jgi:guanylate kinase
MFFSLNSRLISLAAISGGVEATESSTDAMKLFGTSPRKESLRTRVSRRAREEEQMYMQVMAELDAEDDSLDDGEIEIDDSEVYGP